MGVGKKGEDGRCECSPVLTSCFSDRPSRIFVFLGGGREEGCGGGMAMNSGFDRLLHDFFVHLD